MEYDDGLGYVGGATALHIACVEGNTDVVIKLLGVAGVDINAQDEYGQPFLSDMDKIKWCNGLYIEFRQSFAKETFSYDEHLKSQNIQY